MNKTLLPMRLQERDELFVGGQLVSGEISRAPGAIDRTAAQVFGRRSGDQLDAFFLAALQSLHQAGKVIGVVVLFVDPVFKTDIPTEKAAG